MADDFQGWRYRLDSVTFRYVMRPEGGCIPALRRTDGDGDGEGPHLTQEEEYHLMTKQVNDTQGFDIDFNQFRYSFNYEPVDFDKNEWPIEETTRELVDRLSRNSLERYNEDKKTSYEFVSVSKANYHPAGAGLMFFITFQGNDSSSHDEPKIFQARVHYSVFDTDEYITCHLKPEKKVHPFETAEKEGAKKPRLTEEWDAGKQASKH